MDIIAETRKALGILKADQPRLDWIERYINGQHDDPYMPASAGEEYILLAKRSTTNWLPLVIDATAQALVVDNFRRHGEDLVADPKHEDEEGIDRSPDWAHWQRSRMDAGQSPLFRGALGYGASYILTEKKKSGKTRSRGLSPKTTIALFDDPANDLDPAFALHVKRWASGDEPGELWAYDETNKYVIEHRPNKKDKERFTERSHAPHGAKHVPITRASCYVDLEGNTVGLVEPLIPIQDRVNQSVFDLLVAQSYTSFEVRTVSGQAPPVRMVRGEDGHMTPALDDDGNPIPDKLVVNAARWLYAEDEGVKFGHLPASDLKPIIEAIELGQRHLSAIAQVPPHYMLGQITNVNAEGLNAAAVALARKNGEIATRLGEALERMFRIAAEMEGDNIEDDDFGETVWRDLSNASIAQTADALGKFAEMLGIPKRGLWNRVPNVSRSEMSEWKRMWREEHPELSGGDGYLDDEDFAGFDQEQEEVPDVDFFEDGS